MDPEILFEDNHVLVANKRAGQLTQPTESNQSSLETALKAYIKERDSKPGNVFLHAVHRLDQSASGIVVFAKSQKALERLSASIRNHQFVKRYIAIVEGEKGPQTGILVDYLIHGDHIAEVVSSSHEGAKRAELLIQQCTQIGPHRWKLEIELLTGRYHQIRAQLASRHLPILGDGKYGSKSPFRPNAIALHHSSLSFPHPTKGTIETLLATTPNSFPVDL